MMDYIHGNKMCAIKKQYYKRTNTDIGYKLITEDIKGVNINGIS